MGIYQDMMDARNEEIAQAVADERERCAKIIDNLATAIDADYVDPDPKYNTPEAIQRVHGDLVRIAADAIRKP